VASPARPVGGRRVNVRWRSGEVPRPAAAPRAGEPPGARSPLGSWTRAVVRLDHRDRLRHRRVCAGV